MEKQKKENHLKGQTSPYLLQHLYNPVDWYPWGAEALEKSKRENKPLLISIGYSACHWCHVMEEESFEDDDIARLMNEKFVCIKVDREERPDIDHIYMGAVQLLSGRGGWPLNCFALPDGRPFWGGTYFPTEQWKNVLVRISELFATQHGDLEEQAKQLTEGVSGSTLIEIKGQDASMTDTFATERMAKSVLDTFDTREGGTRGAPKFPMPVIYRFLLHHYHQKPETETGKKALEYTMLSLKKMALGGIYDQAGGGFARYSTDEKWKVPHFEKMLYDNAQLVSLYSIAYRINPIPLFKEVTEQTLEFIFRELTSETGTFYSALDADSEGEEGRYYVWKEDEFKKTIGEDARLAGEYFEVGKAGYWEKGNNILLRRKSDEEFADSHGLKPDALSEKVALWRKKLFDQREKRVRPGLDNKVLTSWNGLMIDALVEAYKTFGHEKYRKSATKAADYFLKKAVNAEGKIYHTLTENHGAVDGFLEDYASFINALIHLHQISFREEYLEYACDLTHYVWNNFHESNTYFFAFSSQQGEKLIAPYFDLFDNVIPSSNSIMAKNLFYLGHIFDKNDWVERAKKMLKALETKLDSSWASNWGMLAMHMHADFKTLAAVGDEIAKKVPEFYTHYLPDMLICASPYPESEIPVLQNRYKNGETMFYLCTMHNCLEPVKEPGQVFENL